MEKEYEEKKRIAEKAISIASKMYDRGLAFLLRCTNEFAGVVFKIEEVMVDGTRRRIAHYIGPDYKVYREYLDYMEEGSEEAIDARVLTFHGHPFILTARVRPGFVDDEGEFSFVVIGERANQLARLRIELDKRNAEVKELSYLLDAALKRVDILENDLKTKSEELRRNWEIIRSTTEENSRLKSYITQLTTLIEQYMVGDLEKAAALEHMLQKAKSIGRMQAMDVYDLVRRTVEEHRKIQEELTMLSLPDVKDVNKSIRDAMREMLPDMVKSITPYIVEALRMNGINTDGVDVDKVAAQVAKKLKEEQVAHADV